MSIYNSFLLSCNGDVLDEFKKYSMLLSIKYIELKQLST